MEEHFENPMRIVSAGGDKATVGKLRGGTHFLHKKLYKLRRITKIIGDQVFYIESGGHKGQCKKSSFVRACPFIATSEEIAILGAVEIPSLLDSVEITSLKGLSLFVAALVRNEMEAFHVEHLTDSQMKILNPIIRNAIYSGLTAWEVAKKDPLAKEFISMYLSRFIPNYWEEPELVDDFLSFLDGRYTE